MYSSYDAEIQGGIVGVERRRADDIRYPVRVRALAEQAAPGLAPNPGLARNLSRGGVLLQLNQAAILRAPVRVTLNLRRRTRISLMGTVVWARTTQDFLGCELGVQFNEELPAELVSEIADEEYPPGPVTIQ